MAFSWGQMEGTRGCAALGVSVAQLACGSPLLLCCFVFSPVRISSPILFMLLARLGAYISFQRLEAFKAE